MRFPKKAEIKAWISKTFLSIKAFVLKPFAKIKAKGGFKAFFSQSKLGKALAKFKVILLKPWKQLKENLSNSWMANSLHKIRLRGGMKTIISQSRFGRFCSKCKNKLSSPWQRFKSFIVHSWVVKVYHKLKPNGRLKAWLASCWLARTYRNFKARIGASWLQIKTKISKTKLNFTRKKIGAWLRRHPTLASFAVVFFIYTLLYFLQPLDRYMLDFTTNQEIAERVINGNLGLDFLLTNNNLFGSFLYKLLVAWNVKSFQYSLTFIKVGNYIAAALLIVLLYWALYLSKKQLRTLSSLLLAIFALDFLSIFEEYSSWDVKILLCVYLLSYCLFKISLGKKDWWRVFTFFGIYSLQFLAFYLPFYLIFSLYIFLSIHKSNRNNFFITKSLLFFGFSFLFAVFNLQAYGSEVSLSSSFMVLESYIFPLTRFNKGDWTDQILYMIGSLTIIILACSFLSDFLHRKKEKDNYWFSSLFLISVFYGVFLADKTNFASSEAFALHSFIFGLALIRFYERIPLLKPDLRIKGEMRHPYISISSFSFAFGFFAIVISSVFAGSFCYLYQDEWSDMQNTLSYSNQYDDGLIDDYLGAFGDNHNDKFLSDYDYFVDNGLLEETDTTLPINKVLILKRTAKYIRGAQTDRDGALWLQSNFAIELYAEKGILNFSLYSPIENEITIFVNNCSMGTYTLSIGSNNLYFDVSQFYQKEIILTGYFETDFKGPMDRKGKWACPLIDLYFSNSGGFFPTYEVGEAVWTTQNFAFYYPNPTESLVYTFYEPESFGNNGVNIYINGELAFYQSIRVGFNEVFLNLEDYIESGSSAFVTFKLDEVHKESGGERMIGLIHSSTSTWIKELSFDIDVEDYFMTLEPLSKGLSAYSQTGTLTINGSDVREFSLDYNNMSPSFEMSDYLNQKVHIDIKLSLGCGSGGFDISFSDYFGFLGFESDGSSWTSNEFGFYYPEVSESKIYSFYQPEEFGENGLEVYINGEFSFRQLITKGDNDVFLDLGKEIGKSTSITFKVDTLHPESNSDRMLGLYYTSTSAWINELSFDVDILDYFMTLNPVSEGLSKVTQNVNIVINGNDSRDFILDEDNPKLILPMADYLGEKVHIDIQLEYGSESGGFIASFSDYYGLLKLEEDGSSWTEKEFGFYFPLITSSKVFTFYQPEDFGTNGVSVYVNGVYNSYQEITPGFNEVVVDLIDNVGEAAMIRFDVDSTHVSGEEKLGLDYISSSKWQKNLSFDAEVNGYFMSLVPLSKGLYKNSQKGKITINGNDVRSFTLDEDNKNIVLEMGDYIGSSVHIEVGLSYGCGNGGFDVSFSNNKGLLHIEEDGSSWTGKEFAFYYPEVSSSKVYTFYQPEDFGNNGVSIYINGVYEGHHEISSGFNDVYVDLDNDLGEDILVSFVVDSTRIDSDGDILGLDYISTSVGSKHLSFDVDVTDYFMSLVPLSKGLYKNKQTITLTINGSEKKTFNLDSDNKKLVLEMGKYIGSSVHIDAEFSYGYGNGGFDVSFSNNKGLLHIEEDGSSWTGKEFAFYYPEVSSSKIYTFYQPEDFGNNGVSIYINGKYVSHYDILPDFNEVYLDLSEYYGQNVLVSFVVDSTRQSSDGSSSLGLMYVKTSIDGLKERRK